MQLKSIVVFSGLPRSLFLFSILLPELTKLNSISWPPKMYVQTDRDPTAINTARRTCVHSCACEIQSTCWFLQGTVSLHLVMLWSNLSERGREREKETADEETVRLAKEKGGKRKGKKSKSRGKKAKTWKGWRKYFKGHLPLLSLREKLWLWATSGARLNVKCCL